MNAFTVAGISHLKNVLDKQNHSDMSIASMEGQEEVISRLKFIGCIEKDEKINTRHVNRQPNNVVTKLYRTILYPDNRSNTLKFIKDVISRAFEIIQLNIHQNNLIICHNIISDIIKAKEGIKNIKYTYSDDTKFCCDMDVIIEAINSKITCLKDTLPTLFETSLENS